VSVPGPDLPPLPDTGDVLLIRSWTVAGSFLIIDMTQDPPALISADDVIPAAIVQKLTEIKELIMSTGAAEQAQIGQLADAITAVAAHVSSASSTLAQWIADHQDAPLDFTPALNALSSLQAADATLSATVPQGPQVDTPLPEPVPDPGPVSTDPTTPPDVPPDLPPPADGGSTDVPPDQPPPDQPIA
jgi:hypothetical protein